MELQELHWLEWIGFALIAYGLAAGATRGLTQQFTRFLSWAAALLVTGTVTPALDWLASKFTEEPDSQAMLLAWFSLAALLLAVIGFGGLRRIVFGRIGTGKSFADRLLGGVLGLGVGIVVWLTLLGGAHLAYRLPHVENLPSYSWARTLTVSYRHLPASLQSVLFQFEPAELGSANHPAE